MKTCGPKTFTAGTGGVLMYRLVKLLAGLIVHNTADSADKPIGVTLGPADTGYEAAVQWMKDDDTQEIEAAGAIDLGAEVYAAEEGRIQALPGEATAWAIGTDVAMGDLAVPTVDNGHYYKCTTAGVTDAANEPDWPTDGSAVNDGTAVWTDMGSNVFKHVGTALQAASGAGSIIEVVTTDKQDTKTI